MKYIISTLSFLTAFSCSGPVTRNSSFYHPIENNFPSDSHVLLEAYTFPKNYNQIGKPIIFDHKGSGFFLATSRPFTYIVTAGHICESENSKFPLNMLFDFKIFANYKGEDYPLNIEKIDMVNDLCILSFKDEKIGEGLYLSSFEPQIGELVWNKASPFGIHFSKVSPIFIGTFSGEITELNRSMFTVEVQPGSSGSAILNRFGNVVGVVSGFDRRIKEVNYSPTLSIIQEFVSEYQGLYTKF